MNTYMKVKPGSKLYTDYFQWLNEDRNKVRDAFRNIKEKFGIETNEFSPEQSGFYIAPTSADMEKFSGMLKKSSYGEFKKNSEPHKEWVEAVKDIQHMRRPGLFAYFSSYLFGRRWKERMFNDGDVLYCCIENIEGQGRVKEIPDFCEEIKASEFYQVLEKLEDLAKKEELHGEITG